MSYIPQIINRKVGEVEILDLKGDFVGPWAIRGKEDIQRFVETTKPRNLLINLKDVETIDSLGVKAIIDNLGGGIKSGIVSGNYSVVEMFSRLVPTTEIRFLKDEDEVVHFFAEELVKERTGLPPVEEKRKFPRLKTAFPLEFTFIDGEGEQMVFRAIVTNLSEGGLYAEYLDLEPSSANPKKIDPYDFKMLEMKIKLDDDSEIHGEGKVVRTDLDGEQMGIAIQFYRISDEDRANIQRLIRK
ncbi:MAG: PilZ domain-containing protein [Candidatus Omnitrophica bacterium]|nr:PilZ domain-containing protein [Candidatus Omnitrophota bacterium]